MGDELPSTKPGGIRENAPRNLGFALITIGLGTLTLAVQYKKSLTALQKFSETKSPISISLTAAIVVIFVGIAMLPNMFGALTFY